MNVAMCDCSWRFSVDEHVYMGLGESILSFSVRALRYGIYKRGDVDRHIKRPTKPKKKCQSETLMKTCALGDERFDALFFCVWVHLAMIFKPTTHRIARNTPNSLQCEQGGLWRPLGQSSG